jgi:hypothetical protein
MTLPELEDQFDKALTRPRFSTAGQLHAMREVAARWSAAVWEEAQATGPLELDQEQIARGLDLASRPVFVCGAHRSGTTLVQSLLDSHPALAVLPSEGTFLTNLEPRLRQLPSERRLPILGREWLIRLANPINQAPYWLLGRTSDQDSPYVAYARALIAWWPVTAARISAVISSWPLVAVALAYAHVTSGLSAQLRRWAEKTPTNERFLERLWREFPDAKVIHVVRNPIAVCASSKVNVGRWARLRNDTRILRDLDRTYRTAAVWSRFGSDRYLLVRFEDLVQHTAVLVEQLAGFLCIEPLPVLMQPTIAGLPSVSNSSFTSAGAPGRIQRAVSERTDLLTRFERQRLCAVVGEAAAALGYDLEGISPWRRRLLRLSARIG